MARGVQQHLDTLEGAEVDALALEALDLPPPDGPHAASGMAAARRVIGR